MEDDPYVSDDESEDEPEVVVASVETGTQQLSNSPFSDYIQAQGPKPRFGKMYSDT
jgi:hypothetical protein